MSMIVNPYRFAAAGDGDPYWNNVVLLILPDGGDGDPDFIDASNNTKTLTVAGDAQVDTDISLFSEGTILLDGTGDYLQTSHASDFTFSGNFTIEGWAYKPNNTGVQTFATIGNGGSGRGLITYPDATKLAWVNQPGTVVLQDPDAFPTNQWVHWAISRVGNTSYLGIDGAIKASATDTGTFGGTDAIARIGLWMDGSNFLFNGNLAQVRYTNGVGRYTSSYTVPDAPFPTS